MTGGFLGVTTCLALIDTNKSRYVKAGHNKLSIHFVTARFFSIETLTRIKKHGEVRKTRRFLLCMSIRLVEYHHRANGGENTSDFPRSRRRGVVSKFTTDSEWGAWRLRQSKIPKVPRAGRTLLKTDDVVTGVNVQVFAGDSAG